MGQERGNTYKLWNIHENFFSICMTLIILINSLVLP